MMAEGKPSEAELALLEPFRGKVPDEVFGEPYLPPVSDGSGQDRALLRKASHLLQQAGYPIKDGKRVDAKGEPVTFEFLIDEPTFQPHHMPFIKNLATLGIDATLRVVDPVQFRKLKKGMIERQCQGLVEFIEPPHKLDLLVGQPEAKARLEQDAAWITQGKLETAPMGYSALSRMDPRGDRGKPGSGCFAGRNRCRGAASSGEARLQPLLLSVVVVRLLGARLGRIERAVAGPQPA